MSQKDLIVLDKNTIRKQKQLRYKELEDRGIPEPERSRAVDAEFSDYPTPIDIESWPGATTGFDLAGNINLDLIPSTSEPSRESDDIQVTPYPTGSVNPYPNNPTPDPHSTGIKSNTYNIKNPPAPHSSNYTAMGSEVNSEPPSVGIEGFASHRVIPEWRYPIQQSMVDISIPPIIIEPSGQFNETFNEALTKKKSLLKKNSYLGYLYWVLDFLLVH